jgi:hypothetical protein
MIEDNLSKIKSLFKSRKLAYCRTFNKEDQADRAVLQDLAKFCRAYDSTFAKDDRLSLMLEGRREVWLRIQQYLQLSNEEIYELHHVRSKGE